MDETLKSGLVDAVIALAHAAQPDLHRETKYGGTVFMTDAAVASSLVSGVFAYKDYVSVEFSQGAGFADPAGRLEGKGKLRRHVKLHTLADVDDKDVAGFLAQAFGR